MNKLIKDICYLMMLFTTTLVLTPGCAAQTAAFQQNETPKPSLQVESTQTANTAPNAEALMDISKATLTAPDKFYALVKTSAGDFKIEVTREWAPNGADRFYNMIQSGYFSEKVAIFRAIEGFMFQFGINGNPAVNAQWANSSFQDDPSVGISNLPGTISFAQTGAANSRSVQMFVNLGNNSMLDGPQGRRKDGTPFVPFGKVVAGMDAVGKVNCQYGENKGNVQGSYKQKGNSFIEEKFKAITWINSISLTEE